MGTSEGMLRIRKQLRLGFRYCPSPFRQQHGAVSSKRPCPFCSLGCAGLSRPILYSLRDEVLHLIARVKLSKYEIAQRIFWHGVCGEVELGDLDFLIQQNEDMLYPPDGIPDSDFLRQLRRFEDMQRERRTGRGLARAISLYPPGRITHLVKTGQSKKCFHGFVGCITCGASNAGSYYTPIQKENDDFNEIEISPTLWTDHFPNRVCTEIERIAERFGIDTTLGSPPGCG